MITIIAKVFGAVLLLVGILGFIPAFTPDSHLLGIFHVNGVHNIIHIASGLVALLAGFAGVRPSKMYFRVFGVIYAIVTVLGFVYGNEPILGLVANNMADILLHIVISAAALTLGFGKFGDDDVVESRA